MIMHVTYQMILQVYFEGVCLRKSNLKNGFSQLLPSHMMRLGMVNFAEFNATVAVFANQ